ncbi:MAG TPA: FAD-dependent oxidoreductase, partial [Candidatus Acidoferrales bacterium]|nr:FAD-dependent oxidoreductase [Candidatus Acidoferrales bacterium]
MSKRVVIVGGGVVGLCTAYYSARRGFRVTVLERGPARRDGCSFGNAGMVVPSHFVPLAAPGAVAQALKWMGNPISPFYLKPRFSWDLFRWCLDFWRAANLRHVRRAAPLVRDLSLASRAAYEELAATGDFGLVKKGLLLLCKESRTLKVEAKTAELAHSLGVPAEVLDANQTQVLDPNVRVSVAGSVYFPKDCHLVPHRFIAFLEGKLRELGVSTVWNAAVTGWRRAGTAIAAAQCEGAEHEADEFVLCGGVWSQGLARKLGLRLPLQAGKGYSLTLPRPRQLPQICAILSEAHVAVTPMDGALRFGGTMEIAGLNDDVTLARVRGIVAAIPQYYPDFRPDDFDGIRPWHGLRPCSPDGLPYIGRTARFANLSVAAGHAMMGMSLGPVTGRLMADILSGKTPP